MEGHCRDLRTGESRTETDVVRSDSMSARLGWDRVIHTISSDRLSLDGLNGARGGGHLRGVLDEKLHEERMAGSPLYLLLDDISGASLVAGWAWSRWGGGWDEEASAEREERFASMENICHGFATGSSALETGSPNNHIPVVPLRNPGDEHSWHDLPEFESAAFRRARRIDVTVTDNLIEFDVGFQDTGTDPEHDRVAIHEYEVKGTADSTTGELLSLTAIPHILPFPECPGAINNIQKLVGTPLADMRLKVIETLPGTLGCTHLNDVLRGLAEVPILAAMLTPQPQ